LANHRINWRLLPVFFEFVASLEPVMIQPSPTPVVAATDLAVFGQFADLVADERSFVLTITNPTCTCTRNSFPFRPLFVRERYSGYTLRYSLVLYETEKHGLPVVDSIRQFWSFKRRFPEIRL
jgi:hypothetical protein